MSYLVQRRLGRGGMGVVDLAVDEHGRSVACKRLLLYGSAYEMHRARQRIRREADALAHLDHPNIVPLLEVLDDGDDIVLVLPYLAGGTLADQVHHHGPLSAGQVHALADALFAALTAAHRRGIVHRDIKPANVLFDEHGTPFLADFGVATMRDSTGGLTATGAVIGTPEFMAPEQARGEVVGPASDVFSLAATLLYGATGQPPYGRGEPAVVLQRAGRGRLAALPSDLDRSVRRRLAPALARSPQRRPSAAVAATQRAPGRGLRRPDPHVTLTPDHVGPGGTRIDAGLRPNRSNRPRRPRRRSVGLALGTMVALLVVVGAGALANRISEANDLSGPAVVPFEPAPCEDLPYQPCGQPMAPGTNGVECRPGRADYDADPATGCEVESDAAAGQVLSERIVANLVPSDAVDRYPFRVDHSLNLFCDNVLKVDLTAPAGTTMRLDVLSDGEVLGTVVSTDAVKATLALDQPDCFGNTNHDLVAQVSWVGERRTGESYVLTRSGLW